MADRWVTFDCYGTLIDWEGGIRSAFAELWPDADAQRLLEHYHAVEPRIQAGQDLPYRRVLHRALAAVAAMEELELPVRRGDALAESMPSWSPFPEVSSTLVELRERGWRLAVLSNTDPDLLAASARMIGVPFDALITAREAGSYKPAPGHWERFFADTAAERSLHVHVAASLFHDIEPAHAMGLRAVWINRLGESSAVPRAAELPDLSGLPEVLDELA
jgi:2-haloacid dehalogenase